MLLWGVIAPEINIPTIGYPMAILATIALWIAIAPLAATSRKKVDIKFH
jgi:flagellar biosynthesis protein FliR